MKAITVDQLAQMCLQLSAQGKGSKKVMMSSDDECNSYHEAWNGIDDGESLKGFICGYQLPYGVTKEDLGDYVVLT